MEANQVISQWQTSCAEAESKCSIMEEELDHLKATVESQDTSSKGKDEDITKYTEISQMLVQKEEELIQLKEESKSSTLSLQELKGMLFLIAYCPVSVMQLYHQKALISYELYFPFTDEVLALNQDIASLNEELENQKAQATNSINEWMKKVDASNEEKSKLEIDLAETISKMTELEERCNKFENYDLIASQWEERNRELSESIALLEHQLKEQEQEAFDAVEQWQSACSDLEIKCANLELSLKENLEMRSTRERNSALGEDLDIANTQISRLLEKQKVEREKWSEDKQQVELELATEKERNTAAKNEIEKLASNLEVITTESQDASLQWNGMYLHLVDPYFDLTQRN